MKKPIVELLLNDIETVEDMIEALLQVPKGYRLHPLGQTCQLGVDHYHEFVYLEDSNCVGEYSNEIMEEAKKVGEPTEIEVLEEKLKPYRPELYVVMGQEDLNENGNYEAVLYGVFSKEELAKECGDELIECGNIHRYEIEYPELDEFGWK